MNPTNPWPWRWAGRVHALAWREDRKFLQASVKFFNRLTTKYPDDAQAWSEFAQLRWLQNSESPSDMLIGSACNAFEKAIGLGIEDSAVFYDRFGHALQEQGMLVRAEEAHRKAYELDQDTAYCLGVCLITQGKYDEGLPYVLHDAESVHRDSRGWFQVAICHAECGRFEEAETAYRKALHMNPDYAHAWYNFGGLYWNEGKKRRAARIWRKAVAKFPDFERAEEVRRVLAVLDLL